MSYETIYRMNCRNFEGQLLIIHVSDTTSGTTTLPLYYDLDLHDASLSIINDGEDKFSIIKSTRAQFSFVSSTIADLNTFIRGEDNRWLVEIYVADTLGSPLFTGYLITDATKERFLPNGAFIVELSATDNLGLLKEDPHTKPDGLNPRGDHKIIEFISWSLQKTGLQLPINVIYNLFPEGYTGVSDHTWNIVSVASKMFEDKINVSHNSYDVLRKLLLGCCIVQWYSKWWILRIDEIDPSTYRYYSYDYDGTFTGTNTIVLEKSIGKNESIKLINKNAEVNPERKKKFTKQNFMFRLPIEIIDNIDFSLGAWLSPIFLGTLSAAYDIQYWTLKRGNPDSSSSLISEAYIRRDYEDVNWTYEKSRYVHMTPPTAAVLRTYIESNPIPINKNDKFTVSVDYRFQTSPTGSGAVPYKLICVRLVGNDGTKWVLGRGSIMNYTDPPKWYLETAWSFGLESDIQLFFNLGIDYTQWQSTSRDAPAAPVDGNVYVQLSALNQRGVDFWDDQAIDYQNLQFHYVPWLNGDYSTYNGQYHKVSIPDNYRANIEDEVNISDSPVPLFKGTMFLPDGSRTDKWYNYNAGTTGELGLERFGKYTDFELWNQNNREIRTITGDLLGLDSMTATDIPSCLHKYYFTAPSDHSDDKIYMLLRYSMNLRTCRWNGAFADVYDTTAGKIYDSTHEFKWIKNE